MTFSLKIRGVTAAIAALVLALPLVLMTSAPAQAADPLRREVSREKPLFLTAFYQGGEGPDGTDTINDLWGAVPTDLRENTVLLLIAENSLRNIEATTTWITQQAAAAESAGIPFMVQTINGETPAADRIPIDFFRTLAENHTMMQGINGAELYNARARGQDNSGYLADMMTLAVEQKVSVGTMTSSPGPIPSAASAMCKAAVHELTAIAC